MAPTGQTNQSSVSAPHPFHAAPPIKAPSTRQKFDWNSAAGMAAANRIQAWAAYKLAGDGDPVRMMDGSSGGGRGKPGDIPEALLQVWEVDQALSEWNAPIGWLLVWHFGRHADVHDFEDEATVKLLGLFYPGEMSGLWRIHERAKRRLLMDAITRFGEFLARRLKLGEFKG